tara:strand:- start:67 stop:321 length:255 start_codon:yes stop_codon:yes gene_type:complete
MKRFILEKPYDPDDGDIELWVCDKHYIPFLGSTGFESLVKKYSAIVILEGIRAIPQVCWCCAQNDGDTAPFLYYNGDKELCESL